MAPPNSAEGQLCRHWNLVQLSRHFLLFYRNSQSEGSIFPPGCDWLNKLCISQLIKISFISSYGVVIFITCLQSLRLTPPLQAAEKKPVTTLRMHTIIIFWRHSWTAALLPFGTVGFRRLTFSSRFIKSKENHRTCVESVDKLVHPIRS